MLTWVPAAAASDHRIEDLLDLARDHGVPTSPYEHVLQVGSEVGVVQELLPTGGTCPPLSCTCLRWVREVGAACPKWMDGSDLVHLDFPSGNVLVDAGARVSGIVDWAIRHFSASDVDHWLTVAERGMDR